MFWSYVLLVFCSVVAVGFAFRIWAFWRTGDPKYKHKYFWWK